MRPSGHASGEVAQLSLQEFILTALRRGIWRADPGTGKVYSVRGDGRELGCKNKAGYIVASLHIDGIRKQVKLHQVIWLSVHGRIDDGMILDHRHRVKSHNWISNLRQVDHQGNAENRRCYSGASNPAAKITIAIAQEIRAAYPAIRSYRRTAKKFGISTTLVARIIRNELWA